MVGHGRHTENALGLSEAGGNRLDTRATDRLGILLGSQVREDRHGHALKGGGFIAEVKARPDVRIIEVLQGNRDELPEQLAEWLRGRACQSR